MGALGGNIRKGKQWDLFLQLGRLEGEQELLDVVPPQLVDAASVDGSSQELVHLVLRVQGLLGATAGDKGGRIRQRIKNLCTQMSDEDKLVATNTHMSLLDASSMP